MALDYQQVREQVKQLGENAPQREAHLNDLRNQADDLLKKYAADLDGLRSRVQLVVHNYDPSLRCALPVQESLDEHHPQPAFQGQMTILAADGSQINLDRHAEVQYCLVNVGAIQMRPASAEPPVTRVTSQLFYADDVLTITDNTLALKRDLSERALLADLAAQASETVVTFTDGPMELWGGKGEGGEEASQYQKSLAEYLQVLARLSDLNAITAGYVDKPGANLVVRLLEVAGAPQDKLAGIRKYHPLQGVTDRDLYYERLGPGERSAVFAMQSQSAKNYKDQLALHFFYLNTGRPGKPWLARVEIPGWVAANPRMLDQLHAVLVDQCRIMGARPYPYLLHRAHETALVTLEEKEQVTQMIALELRRRGVIVGEKSNKQVAKDQPGRMRMR
jgi:hypothetical protein